MPSSISSSEAVINGRDVPGGSAPDNDTRQTSADRPGVAQPVPTRPVPAQPWGRIFLGTLVLFALMLGAWEGYWRAFGATPGTRNSDGLWSIQRRRIDHGEGDATVLLGSSRMFFDLQLPVWAKLDGRRPIQLALEGTLPLQFMEDLAADSKFTGRLLVGVAPELFFSGYALRGGALKYTRDESPSQRVGQWLSMQLIEPVFAFYDPDFALATVLERQAWPVRPGDHPRMEVRKLAEFGPDRSTHLWSKVETDPAYREVARQVWLNHLQPRDDMPPPDKLKQIMANQLERAAKAVTTLRARGVQVVFVRAPSSGPYLEMEHKVFPRGPTWDALLAATGAPGIHFEDYPELQGLELPEWSHLTHADAERFTAALHAIIKREYWKDAVPPELVPLYSDAGACGFARNGNIC